MVEVFLTRRIQRILLRRYSVTLLGREILIKEYMVIIKDALKIDE